MFFNMISSLSLQLGTTLSEEFPAGETNQQHNIYYSFYHGYVCCSLFTANFVDHSDQLCKDS